MAWFPGMQRYYNETVPQNVVIALGNEYENYSVPEALRHPGVTAHSRYDDVISPMLGVVPQLQNYAVAYREYNPQVVQVQQKR